MSGATGAGVPRVRPVRTISDTDYVSAPLDLMSELGRLADAPSRWGEMIGTSAGAATAALNDTYERDGLLGLGGAVAGVAGDMLAAPLDAMRSSLDDISEAYRTGQPLAEAFDPSDISTMASGLGTGVVGTPRGALGIFGTRPGRRGRLGDLYVHGIDDVEAVPGVGSAIPLSEAVTARGLLDTYPELSDYIVRARTPEGLPPGVNGVHRGADKTIDLIPETMHRSHRFAGEVLSHELQHAVQLIDGRASPLYNTPVLRDMYARGELQTGLVDPLLKAFRPSASSDDAALSRALHMIYLMQLGEVEARAAERLFRKPRARASSEFDHVVSETAALLPEDGPGLRVLHGDDIHR